MVLFLKSGENIMNKKIESQKLEELLVKVIALRINTTLVEECFAERAREKAFLDVIELKREYRDIIGNKPEEQYLDALEEFYKPRGMPPQPTFAERLIYYLNPFGQQPSAAH